MEVQNQFKLASSNLFERILFVASTGAGIIFITSLLNPTKNDAIINGSFLVIVLIAFLIYRSGAKVVAFHFLPIALCTLYLFSVIKLDFSYIVILLIYPAGLIYCFIFFRKKKVLLFYLVFFISNQLIVVVFLLKNIGYLTSQHTLFTELTNVVATNIAIFFMCYFYLRQIRELQLKSDISNLELRKNQAYVEIQKSELERKNKELKSYIESNLQLENFAHLASHELKTPVRNVLNFTNLLERSVKDKLSDKEKEYFHYITDYTNKMNDLIVDLYKLSSVSKTKINYTSINMSGLINQITKDFNQIVTTGKGKINYDNNVSEIKGQENLIKQVFSNLIGNALKFTRPDTPPMIKINSEETDLHWNFKISDNGIGINPQYREKIFLIFKRLHSDSSFEGTGIGLALCKKIVELHKGDISVEGNNEGGTTFVISIPKQTSPELN